VGVSGGVDSSVSAALLLEQGFDVVGVFIRTWQPDWITCTWQAERRDAMRVCAHLNIPFVELNLEDEYKKGVADYMIDEYKKGRTPNPDVMCNREVKFGGFLTWALEHGADYIATGHYCRVVRTSLVRGKKSVLSENNFKPQLLKGIDPTKDQSYFLWTLTSDQLENVLFPIGHLQKTEVRKLADKFKLPTATKKDSQGICFIGEINMKEFLAHYGETKVGDVLNEKGEVIGRHDGVLLYTLGERHGFEIIKKGTSDKPYYVVSKDFKRNTITVSQTPNDREISRTVRFHDCVWREALKNKNYEAQIRYHGVLKKCTLKSLSETSAEISFEEPDFSLSGGQSVVVYDGDICIGGGVAE